MTIDDLENLSGHDRYELLRGKLHEMSPPTESHSDAHLELTLQIARFAQAHDLRKVFIETAFVFERSPDTLLIPDIAFVRELRLPADRDPQRACQVAPDLAVEIVSPTDRRAMVAAKARQYVALGVQLVWIVDPRDRTVTVYHGDGGVQVLNVTDTLVGDPVLPGFRLSVSAIFGS